MNTETINTQLYEKMFAEQERYRDWLLHQPPEEILNHTYEYTTREDILMTLEDNDLSFEQAWALLSSPTPLADVFKEFENRETDYMDVVRESMASRANTVIDRHQAPLYLHDAAYAVAHNEMEHYTASLRISAACKNMIEDAIAAAYQDIVCTHIDKKHIHNHIIWNSTALSCDRKFRNFWGSTKAVRHLSDLICAENGLSIVEHPNRHGKSYNKWRGERAEPTQLEQVRSAIDAALSQKPADWDAFVALLAENGCEVKRRGKTLSFRGAGWERFIRADRLGENYLEAALLDAILGRQEHTPQRSVVTGAPKTPSLLIDIDAKIRAGKGVGYQRWASKFNAKQLGQTMTYLKEHDLMNYADLKKKTQAATEQFHALSAQIKSAEARMAEIAVLRGHIVNFAKTKKTFDAYKASGYTKKFLAEHEAEILLHRSAKRAFQELNVKKLPTVKSLQEEYAKLLSEKKAAYPDYRKAKQEMQELLIVQANVAKILGAEPREAEHEKEQKQR